MSPNPIAAAIEIMHSLDRESAAARIVKHATTAALISELRSRYHIDSENRAVVAFANEISEADADDGLALIRAKHAAVEGPTT